uniref:CS domain-containing protein n=1 Tax=Aureoumbra lagunensis TaxID=44058 RepID=A0A7S3NQ58_9STRA
MRAAGTAGGIQPLLDAFFSFLNRRTDFYVVHDGKVGESYAAGFAFGQAEKMLLDSFHSFPQKSLDEVTTKQEPKKAPTKPAKSLPSSTKRESGGHDFFANVQYNQDGKQIPVGNGGVAENHTWTQTLTETTIYFEVPSDIKARDITCKISSTRLELKIGNGDHISDRFYAKIAEDGSMWTLDREEANNRASLVLSLEKVTETWWPSVFANAAPKELIDTTKVDSSKKIDEYDEYTQATIRKIMFDQRQKARGLPTSDEIQNNELLEKVKYLPGSPFLESSSSIEASSENLNSMNP